MVNAVTILKMKSYTLITSLLIYFISIVVYKGEIIKTAIFKILLRQTVYRTIPQPFISVKEYECNAKRIKIIHGPFFSSFLMHS